MGGGVMLTPQDFIDAAGKVSDPKIVAALLAAAEQGDQVEREQSEMAKRLGAILRLEDDLREQIATLMRLALESVNGWACFATREIEHKDISRIHAELARIRESK